MNKFRKYTDIDIAIKNNYQKIRTKQTFDHVKKMREKYLVFNKKMDIWDVFEKLNTFIDISDPDIKLPNQHHLFQTAEAMKNDNLPDWLQLTGLIHDMGKIIFLWGNDEDGTSINEQWSIVGDTFITGCQIPDECVYPEFNKNNPDMNNILYNTKYGIYKPNCGLDNTYVSFGHDEYLYHMLKYNKTKLPDTSLYIIRYHSLYPWHDKGCYKYLMNTKDSEMLEYVKLFNKYDLYTKSDTQYNIFHMKEYYNKLIIKFFGSSVLLY